MTLLSVPESLWSLDSLQWSWAVFQSFIAFISIKPRFSSRHKQDPEEHAGHLQMDKVAITVHWKLGPATLVHTETGSDDHFYR